MFVWELKRARSEVYYKDGTMKLKGRTSLQWLNIQKAREAGGIGDFVYPANLEEKIQELIDL